MMHIVVEVMLWYDDRESLHYSIASMINVSVASEHRARRRSVSKILLRRQCGGVWGAFFGWRTQNDLRTLRIDGFSCSPIYEYLNICPLKHSSSRRKDPTETRYSVVASCHLPLATCHLLPPTIRPRSATITRIYGIRRIRSGQGTRQREPASRLRINLGLGTYRTLSNQPSATGHSLPTTTM